MRTGLQHHGRRDELAAGVVRHPQRRAVTDGGMRLQRRLDLDRPDAVAGADDHVVGAGHEEQPAVLVFANLVTRVPHT